MNIALINKLKQTKPSIYEVEIRDIQMKIGHEGEYFRGIVYLDGKELGIWSQDADGCVVDRFYFNEKQLDKPLNKYRKIKQNPNISIEKFMLDIIVLENYLKMLIQALENEYTKIIVVTDSYDYCIGTIPATNDNITPEISNSIQQAKQAVERYGRKPVIKEFKSPDDFIIK